MSVIELEVKEDEGAEEDDGNEEEAAIYTCQECNYQTLSISNLSIHSHVKLRCYLCKFSTQLKSEFNQHMHKHKPKGGAQTGPAPAPPRQVPVNSLGGTTSQFHCKPCKLAFSSSLSLENHQRVRHTSSRIKCNLCDFSHVSPVILKQHMKIEHPALRVSDFFCKECSLSFSSQKVLESHMNVRHGGTIVTKSAKMATPRVNQNVKRKRTSVQIPKTTNKPVETSVWHVVVDKEKKSRYSCRTCGFTTDDENVLTEHEASFPSIYVCSFCSFETHWSSKVTEHKIAEHPDSVKFPCDLCEFRTCNNAGLHTHKRIVHGIMEPII